LRAWNTWNNFDYSVLRQIESASNSLRNRRSEFSVLGHIDVLVRDGALHNLAVARVRMSRPVLHEAGRYTGRFQMRDTETAEAVESLFLDSRTTEMTRESSPRPRGALWKDEGEPTLTSLRDGKRLGVVGNKLGLTVHL
jgi:hypothetical protein